MKRLITFIVCLLVISCGNLRQLPHTDTIQKDSIRVSKEHLDSVYANNRQIDSVYKRDSIVVFIKGDTIAKYVEKETVRIKLQRDTVYKFSIRTDTVYIEHRDTLRIIPPPIEVEKPIKWYNRTFIWIGRLCCLAVLLWLLFSLIKRKL